MFLPVMPYLVEKPVNILVMCKLQCANWMAGFYMVRNVGEGSFRSTYTREFVKYETLEYN